MKILFKYIKYFLKEDFRLITYLPVIIYIFICITINYYFDFEHKILDKHVGTLKGFIFFFVFYGLAYFPVAIYVLSINKKQHVLKKSGFWIKTIFIIALLAGSAFFSFYKDIIDLYTDLSERYLIRKILINSRNFLIFLLPLLFFWYFLKPSKSGFLWIKLRGFNPRPYFYILLIMLPIIFIASFSNDFLNTYPTFKPWTINIVFGLEKWQMAGIYEIFYGLDFITVEMIFRGALVLGLYKLLGKDCILPMISVYCFLHFGKPMGEAVSSIFGGYILGIIAINTESIVGGSMVHMGVAWMMEVFAYSQHGL
jgi:hypothetical protein